MTQRSSARSTHAWLLAAMTASGSTAAAAATPLPDDFLEYLGRWDADDADWQVANAVVATPVAATTTRPRISPLPGGKSNSSAVSPGNKPPPASSTERKP
jgi:hypothetical protein